MTNPSSFRPIIAHTNSRITYYNIPIMKHCINSLRSTLKLSLPYSHKPSLSSRLSFSQAARSMSTKTEPQFSSNYNPIQGHQALGTLLKDGGGRWTLLSNGMGIERSFKFKGFKKTWDFMTSIADECKTAKHHPEWSNIYNTTFIRWTTHSPPGISEKDIHMAQFCDAQALIYGELVPEETEQEREAAKERMGRELADRAAREGGDCCVPKPKPQTV